MAGVRVRIEGGEELRRRLNSITQRAPDAMEKGLLKAGQILRTEAVRTIYERFATKKEKKAGIVFATPHVHLWGQTGALKASITVQRGGPGRVEVGSPLIYAPVHEFGTTITIRGAWLGRAPRGGEAARGGRTFVAAKIVIPKRPYLGPALETKHSAMQAAIADGIRALLEGRSA